MAAASPTRVAVVQLAYHPAKIVGGRSPLADPLFDPRASASSLDPQGPDALLSPALHERITALGVRVREIHGQQIVGKATAILGACRRWGVDLVVFPEYSLACELLPAIAAAAGEMVVIAGSHAVDERALEGSVYRDLDCPEGQVPEIGEAVCPVLFRGRLLALQPELAAGVAPRPIDLPEETGIPGPIGALVGLEALLRAAAADPEFVAACRLLAVPNRTPSHVLDPFAAVGPDEAQRLGRPIAYANIARAGGSTIVAGDPRSDAAFPEGVGTVVAGDEGVIVADVDLRDDAAAPILRPFASASLVYRTHPHGDAFAAWIDTLHQAIDALPPGDAAPLFELLDAVDESRQFLLDAGAIPGALGRGRRYDLLLARLATIESGDALARLTREVIVPPTILPFEHVREAMSLGVYDAIHGWWQESEDFSAGEIAHRLKAGGKGLRMPPPEMWTEAGRRTIAAIRAAVAGTPSPPRGADKRALATRSDEVESAAEAEEEPSPITVATADIHGLGGATAADLVDRVRADVLADLGRRRAQKLRDVDQRFEPPDVTIDDAPAPVPALAALDAWIRDDPPTALLLGEAGAGKSALLTVWAERRWLDDAWPLPVLVALREAGVVVDVDADALVLRALGREDSPIERAHLASLVRGRVLVPCFDGVDEIVSPSDAAALRRRLHHLSERTGPWGKVLIAGRVHTFTGDGALARALPDARRLVLSALSAAQVAHLIGAIHPGVGEAEAVLRRLASTYDLLELVRRPLLLGMVLQSLDELDPSARVGAADVYRAYLSRWLRQGHGDAETPDDPRILFAEELADALWRSGAASAPIHEIHHRVRGMLREHRSDADAIASVDAFASIERAAFFVRDGDALRFAHRSFLEFFLARGLIRNLDHEPARRLATRPLTAEVLRFVDQLLRREFGDPFASAPIQGVRSWLVSGAGSAASAEGIDPRINALRLLLQLPRLGMLAGSGTPDDARQWVPEGAQLAGIDLRGEDLRHAQLADVDLRGARLGGADLRDAELVGAWLEGADLGDANLVGAEIEAALVVDALREDARELDEAAAEAPARTADLGQVLEPSPSRPSAAGASVRSRDRQEAGARSFVFDEVAASSSIAAEEAAFVREVILDDADHAAEDVDAEDDERRSFERTADDDDAPRAGADSEDGRTAPVAAPPKSLLAPPEAPRPGAGPQRRTRGDALDEPVPRAMSGGSSATPVLAPAPAAPAPPPEPTSTPASAPASPLKSLLRKLAPAKREPSDGHQRLREKLAEREASQAPNPFLPGRPLRDAENLPGREDILAELATLIHQRSPALLKGPRRAGKSSILYTLARLEGERRPVYHRSLEGKAPRSPDDFACLIDPVLKDSRDPADALVGALEAARVPPVILLDEVAWLTRADEALFPWLRGLGQEGLCALVLAGSHADWLAVIRAANRTPGSSFGNDYTIVEIEALRERDALDFITTTAPRDVEIDADRGARWIYELCGGWPFYLQVMGYALVEEARQGKRSALVDKGALFDLYERRLLRDRVAVFASRWVDLRPPAQAVLVAVLERTLRSRSGRDFTPYRDLGRRERALLSDAGVIDGQRGWLLDLPFRDWLIRNFDELEVGDGDGEAL